MQLRLRALVFAAAISPGTAQDAYDLPWRIAANGRLEVRQPADSGGANELQFGDWVPMFPGLLEQMASDGGFGELAVWGPLLAVPLLVHGDGGAAAIDEATLRLRKLTIPMAIDRIALNELTPDPWLDMLRVQHLATADVASVTFALMNYAKDAKRDAFVRAAAAAALVGRPGTGEPAYAEEIATLRIRRNGIAALHAGLARLPDDVDLVIGVHGAALPRVGPLLAAWRQVMLRFHSSVQLASGGSISPAQMSTGQLVMDRPGQLPFELAMRFGNWRVDHALLALRWREHAAWWLHAGGVFQPQRVAAGLREGKIEPTVATDDEVQATAFGWSMRATSTEFEAWQEGLDRRSSNTKVTGLHDRAAAGTPPVWAFVPPTSRLAANVSALEHTLDVRFDPVAARVTATATCPGATQAATLIAKWRAWQAERRCEPTEKIGGEEDNSTWGELADLPPGCGEPQVTALVWRRCVQAVQAQQGDAIVRWTLDLSPFPLVDLVRLLGCSPALLIEEG